MMQHLFHPLMILLILLSADPVLVQISAHQYQKCFPAEMADSSDLLSSSAAVHNPDQLPASCRTADLLILYPYMIHTPAD